MVTAVVDIVEQVEATLFNGGSIRGCCNIFLIDKIYRGIR